VLLDEFLLCSFLFLLDAGHDELSRLGISSYYYTTLFIARRDSCVGVWRSILTYRFKLVGIDDPA
jgi:hypothetical protein